LKHRSIQTLPKTRSDNQVLPWLIHPQAEDMYSIGVMIWKVFTDTEPWRGILDTDLQGLRYVAQDDYRIQRALEGEVHGELSRQLLLKCLRTRPQDRETARDILDWISQEPIKEGLIGEWKMYSSDTRSARRAKTFYGFEDEDDEDKKKPRKKANTMSKRGRPKAQKELFLN
jgi:serine/threonine protein kinase